MTIEIRETKEIQQQDVIALYKANEWSSAEKPAELYQGLLNSHSLITAWHKDKRVGLGNALSDGFLLFIILICWYIRIIRVKESEHLFLKGLEKNMMDFISRFWLRMAKLSGFMKSVDLN